MASKEYIVYMHVNKINNKVYIGQTSQSLNKRWQNGNGYKSNQHFYSAIIKYGWDNFEHLILNQHLSLEEANKLEAQYIEQYDSCNPLKGYNLRLGGNNSSPSVQTVEKMKLSHLGYTPTEQQKIKNSQSNKGKHNRPHTDLEKEKIAQSKKKKVVCLTDFHIFDSIMEAELWCGLKPLSNIGNVCRGKRKTAGKHPITGEPLQWAFLEDLNL